MATYDIVNPHDSYTLVATTDEVATVAAAVLGPAYAVSREGWSTPVALFGMEALDQFCVTEFGCSTSDLLSSVLETEPADLAAALNSIVIDRAGLERFAGGGELTDEMVDRWHDARRTSSTDLRAEGRRIAGLVFAKAAAGQVRQHARADGA